MIRPMLACTIKNFESLRFPLVASPKYRGIRCLVGEEKVLSRSGKPIRNKYIRDVLLSNLKLCTNFYYDGELVVGDGLFETTSGVNSIKGEPAFTYNMFDFFQPNHKSLEYKDRYLLLEDAYRLVENKENIKMVTYSYVFDALQLTKYYEAQLELGFEGAIYRNPEGIYKHGRSTAKEQYLLRMKPEAYGTATVLVVNELMHNVNDMERSPLDYASRSKTIAGQCPSGLMGSLTVDDGDMVFNIGTGFSAMKRRWVWRHQKEVIGKVVKYKYIPIEFKDRPTSPVYINGI